jgi:hypothetical protein
MSRVNDDEVLVLWHAMRAFRYGVSRNAGRTGGQAAARDCDGCAGLAPWLGLVSVGDPVPEEFDLVG